MGPSRHLCLVVIASAITASSLAAQQRTPGSGAEAGGSNLFMLGTDMHRPVLYLFEIETDRMITIDLTNDPEWPGGMPLHAIVTPDGKKAYLSMMSVENEPLTILALAIGDIDWQARTADIPITNVIQVEPSERAPRMRIPSQTDPRQPVTDLWKPGNQQLHGPSVLPSGKFVYYGQWTDGKIRVIDVTHDRLAGVDPIREGPLTEQIHGVFIDPSGRRAIANGYYFDRDYVTVFRIDAETGDLGLESVIELIVDEGAGTRAAWTHFVDWLDDRYAVTATQQTGPTSFTPTNVDIVGPGVWLVDAVEGTARMIIGPTEDPEGNGIYKPASDMMVVDGKLYVAEEDTGDESIDASFISIFDLSDRESPKFLRRLRPGVELPEGWDVSHEFYRTPDGRWLYAQSWSSGHLVKIDPRTDRVVKVWSKEDGFVMPHGNFIPGNLR